MIKNENIGKVIEAVNSETANQKKVNLCLLKCIKELNNEIGTLKAASAFNRKYTNNNIFDDILKGV